MVTDQLTVTEIIQVADVVQKHYKNTPLKFNVITLKVSNYGRQSPWQTY